MGSQRAGGPTQWGAAAGGSLGRLGTLLGPQSVETRRGTAASPSGLGGWGMLPSVEFGSWRVPTTGDSLGLLALTGVSLLGTPLPQA